MPTFLNAPAALWAAAFTVPPLIALYFLKLRRQERIVPSTLLWRRAVMDLQVNAPFQRLRRNLLLLLQLLILAVLCLALARPVVDSTVKAGKLTVLLIDRSASMAAVDVGAARSRLDIAKSRAKDLIATLDRDAAAMVIAFDDEPQLIQTFTADAQLLRSAIDTIAQTDRGSSLKLAYKMAEAPATFVEAQLRANVTPEVFLLSDGRVADADSLRLSGRLTFDRIGSDQTPNVGIVALDAKRDYEKPNHVEVFARLANFGPDPVSPMVQLSVDGQVAQISGVDLLPERWDEPTRRAYLDAHPAGARDAVWFTLDLDRSAVIEVRQLPPPGDALAADDAAWVVVPPPRPLRLMLVTRGNYFLEKLAAALKVDSPATVTPAAYESSFYADGPANPAHFDVIVFDRYQPDRLPDSGAFIYFGVVPKPLSGWTTPNAAGAPREIEDISILDWRRDHPMLRHLSLSRLYIARALALKVPPEAEILVDGDKGPLIVLAREGRRTHLVIAFDLLQSTWPVHHASFPLFMHNAMQYLALGADMAIRRAHTPGDAPVIPRAALDRAGLDRAGLDRAGFTGPVRLIGPGLDRPLTLSPTGDGVLPALEKVGLYRTEPALAPYSPIAVNLLNPIESDLSPADHAPGGVGRTVSGARSAARRELWRYLLAAAIPLLLLEWFIHTRRAHL